VKPKNGAKRLTAESKIGDRRSLIEKPEQIAGTAIYKTF